MRYFIVSDIHSFFNELKNALKDAGFDKRNKNHTLIVCGDVFDRGPDTVALYRYLKTLPKKRLILIRGNHEHLYFELLKKSFPDQYDFRNHTVDTFCQIAGYSLEILQPRYWYKLGEQNPYERLQQAWQEIVKEVKASPITAWLKSAQWRNYYELDRYIFVHSFIPLRNIDGLQPYYVWDRRFEYFAGWREKATDNDWYDASWGCPYAQYLDGYFKEEAKAGKILVCGHWCVVDFRQYINNKLTEDSSTYFYENLIALDGGVWTQADGSYWHPQNVLVVDSEDFSKRYRLKDGILEGLKEETTVPRIETVTIAE